MREWILSLGYVLKATVILRRIIINILNIIVNQSVRLLKYYFGHLALRK